MNALKCQLNIVSNIQDHSHVFGILRGRTESEYKILFLDIAISGLRGFDVVMYEWKYFQLEYLVYIAHCNFFYFF